jgi:hypothetical protein
MQMGAVSTASPPDVAELISLSSAALIAYYNISGGSVERCVGELLPRLNAVAAAIASLVPVYIVDAEVVRPLTRLELALSEFDGGGANLVHRVRNLTYCDLRVHRRDLLEAMHALQGSGSTLD